MKTGLSKVITVLCLSSALIGRAATLDSQQLLGFETAATSQSEREIEARFDSTLNRDDLRDWMKLLAARPHHLGSPYDKQNADFIASQFRSWGYDTQIEQFEVLFPTPEIRLLEMVSPEKFTARLAEEPLKEDATSSQTSEQLPTYNAYSIDGDVTGELVYVNYGIPKDYETLNERGIDVKGKIVIARYGGSWRGIKPKVAAEHGALGCIIYSDPRDDGYYQGDVYPKGAWRNEYGAQRGSVADMPLYPGDPLTPGIGATKDAKRLAIKDAATLTKIPVLPISYGDALPLLRNLSGPMAPEAWRGALPIPYHLGAGPAKVHLRLRFSWNMVPANDVIARLPGSERPDEWIIRGNHHDAWVNGAHDPLSGQVAMMEEARAVGELARTGWHPKRTIIYCAWDGEEPGLLGSTEWVETHADLLQKNAAVYINSDSNGRGFLNVSGSHTLEKFANGVARDVIDPEKKISAYERVRAVRILRGSTDEKREARERGDLRISALGSGSDYSPFLQHLGIASLDIGYSGESGGGSYHSIYDSFDHFTRFIDPNFEYGIAQAKTTGHIVLRFANADVLPFEFTDFADTVETYVKEVMKLADDVREETKEENRQMKEKTLEYVSDPSETDVPPGAQSPAPAFDFAPLQKALGRLQKSAQSYDAASKHLNGGSRNPSVDAKKALDAALMQTERLMTRSEGLPRRPWYKHQLYAPGFYTGYGVKTLPGIREAIEQHRWDEVSREIHIISQVLDAVADQIHKAASLAKGAG